MAEYHTVEQGEYLSLIASKYGFASYKTIWNHDNNTRLREVRPDPNVLLPGDQVFIPEKQFKTVGVDAGRSTRFQVVVDKVLLRLKLEELFGKPLANAPCEVRVEGRTVKKATGEDAILEIQLRATTREAELVVKDPDSRLEDIVIPIKIGGLDPVEEKSGQVARLNNLGYFSGSAEEIDEQLLKSAVEEFQCDHGLAADGRCGPITQAKLKSIHGC